MNSNTLDIVLASLKILGFLVAGFFAILSTKYSLRNRGRLTSWGKRAIYITTSSIGISIVAQSIESYLTVSRNSQAALETKQKIEETKTILTEIQKIMLPIKDVSIYASIILPEQNEHIKSYADKFRARVLPLIRGIKPVDDKQSVKNMLKHHRKFGKLFDIITENRDKADMLIPSTLSINHKSSIHPKRLAKPELCQAICFSNLSFRVFKEPPKKIDSNIFVIGGENPPDLILSFKTSELYEPMSLHYEIQKNQFSLTDILKEEPVFTKTKTSPFAIPDLAKSYLYMTFPLNYPPLVNNYDTYFAIMDALVIDFIVIHIGTREYWLPGKKFTKIRIGSKNFIWQFVFPENLEKLRTLDRD